jgi:hypothetical protein
MLHAKIVADLCNIPRFVGGLGSQLMVYRCGHQFAGQNLLRQQQKGKAIGATRYGA